MKTCPACDHVQGNRALNCLKCGEPFVAGPRPVITNKGKTSAKPKPAEQRAGAGRYVELGESLATIETLVRGFERSADMDEVIGEVQRARSIARTLG